MKSIDLNKVSKQVFEGHNALTQFLDPNNHAYIPLVEIPEALNPYYSQGIHIYAKLMMFLPLGNVKSIPARELVMATPSDTKKLVEASSGNTVFSMALISRAHGFESTHALVSKEVSQGKLKLLRLAGVHVEVVDEPICPDPGDPNGAIARAKKRGESDGWYNPGQYDNEANPRAHEIFTAPQIYDQLDGRIDIFGAGLGTTGTLLGTAKYLKEKLPNLKVVGVVRKPNNTVPGVRTQNLLKEVAFDWQKQVDLQIAVGSSASYDMSLRLIRHGILAGPSSGFALQGLIEGIGELLSSNAITGDKPLNAVCIFPDGPLPYIDDYFTYLPSDLFPEVINKELLLDTVLDASDKATNASVASITVEELNKMTNGSARLIDVREPWEFEDHHIDGSINMPLKELAHTLPMTLPSRDVPLIMICKSGSRSVQAVRIASQLGYDARSLDGGTTAWSDRGYHRIQPGYCKQ